MYTNMVIVNHLLIRQGNTNYDTLRHFTKKESKNWVSYFR